MATRPLPASEKPFDGRFAGGTKGFPVSAISTYASVMPATRFLRTGPLTFLALFFGLLVVGRTRFFRDPGTFWHTATGEQFFQTRTFLATDPFTYTFAGHSWTPYEWLGEVPMALLHRAGGWELLLVVAAAIIATTFATLTARLARTGLHPAAVGCVAGLAVASCASHFHVRPHLVTMAGFAIIMVLLTAAERGRMTLRQLVWLVPIFVVWCNIHGGAAGGIATVGFVFFGWLMFWLAKRESPVQSTADAATVCLLGVAVLLTPLANPYGLALPRTWLAIMAMPEVKRVIVEHMPVNPRDPANAPFFALGGLYLFLLLGLRRWPRATWLVPVVWFAMGCDRIRHSSLFAVVALVAIANVFPFTRWAAWLAKYRPDYYVPRNDHGNWDWRPLVLPVISFIVFATLPILGVREWVRFDKDHWPVDLVDTMTNEASDRHDIPLFNEINTGGFLIWHTPQYHTFADDRCELFGGAWLERMANATRDGGETARRFLEEEQTARGRFEYAVVRVEGGFFAYFDGNPEWVSVKRTDSFAFYRTVTSVGPR
jgi:hypothetical protein